MKTAYIHPESANDVVLQDGFSMSREEAKAKGYTVAPWPYKAQANNVATRHPHRDGLVVLQHGVTVQEGTAKAMGYKIADGKPAVQTAPLSPHRAWRSAVITSAEAKDRPDAAAELVLSQSEATMSVDAARSFLRGLPTESPTVSASAVAKTPVDPRAARLAEIQGSMAAFNKSRGHASKPMQGTVDPIKVRRLTEIRHNALMMNGRAQSQEAKVLKLALDTNATTGAPLERSLAQLGFDVSKLFATR